jgi:hypothetical protein
MVFKKECMKILMLSFFLVLCSLLYSQGNLQFNQVLNLKSGNTYTVPTGKCLKVESILMNGASITSNLSGGGCAICSYASITYMQIGNITYTATPPNQASPGGCPNGICPATNSASLTLPSIIFPIWLKSGEIVNLNSNGGVLLTAIEFNIIP